MFVRYSRNALQEERSFHYSTNSAINPADTGQNNPFTRENHNATVQFTKTLSATLVLDIARGSGAIQIGERRGAGRGRGAVDTRFFAHVRERRPPIGFPNLIGQTTKAPGRSRTYTSPIAQTNVFSGSSLAISRWEGSPCKVRR